MDWTFALAAGQQHGTLWFAVALQQALTGPVLSAYLNAVAPHGTPTPSYILRAYELPDFPFPTVLKGEHAAAPDGLGEQYLRFSGGSRKAWMAALAGEGPGLTPVLAWTGGAERRFLDDAALTDALACLSGSLPGMPDTYLGRGLLFLANPEVRTVLPDMMSLGGATKLRLITAREYPLWVSLPAHQPALLAAPLLPLVEHHLGPVLAG
ncbi:MAG: hypothetical protein EXR52_07475 [Dehalococcoidia bacterium]|nr:hypothetical protein [Dehalococcoidia bacterium]